MTRASYASTAWLLIGITRHSAMGWLTMADGRLQFSIEGDVVFDLNAAAIQSVNYPWYYFSGGVKIRSQGDEFRLSFVKPNGAEVAVDRMLAESGNPAALLGALEKFSDIGEGRRAGKRWKEILPER